MNHVLQTTFKDMGLYNHFYLVLYGCSLENCSHTYDMEAIPLLSVSQEQMGQPHVNMFSSLELSDSPLCLFKAPSEVSGNLGQLEISSGAHLEQSHSRACVSFQDVTHTERKIRHHFSLSCGLFRTKHVLIAAQEETWGTPWLTLGGFTLEGFALPALWIAEPELGENGQASLMPKTVLAAESLLQS